MGRLVQSSVHHEDMHRDKKGTPYLVKHVKLYDPSKYSGEKLRELRAERGVGRRVK